MMEGTYSVTFFCVLHKLMDFPLHFLFLAFDKEYSPPCWY